MTIRLLPPQLANQIAAGEVVERPASVIKELVENSLDAGATEIQIDVEKGGSKLLRVRDNGAGIAKDELTLALSRHATSKIQDFSDLARIVSLGFRGEALASISSVSRLTLTSKPASQENAWQAMAEGRDMTVQVRPAAHPAGTTIEVLDLFFNTPARRRFLKSDKTEFSHIDELVKRLALSRPDISWTLTHNGQTVRQLRAVQDEAGQQRRLQQLCGRQFASHAVQISSLYEDMQLSGWLLPPSLCTAQLQCQYCYVNGRMMRDKLLQHAIRQAYGDQLLADAVPAFVLYLVLDPSQLDVNVHPAKHEVRFHQARLVHDFLVSALHQALLQAEVSSAPADIETKQSEPAMHHVAQGGEVFATVREPEPWPSQQQSPQRPSPAGGNRSQPAHRVHTPAYQQGRSINVPVFASTGGYAGWPVGESRQPAEAANALSQQQSRREEPVLSALSQSAGAVTVSLLAGPNPGQVLFCAGQQLWLADVAASAAPFLALRTINSCSLLLPERLKLSAQEVALLTAQAEPLNALGFDLLLSNHILIVRAVPDFLRGVVLAQLLPRWWQRWPAQPDKRILWQLLLELALSECQLEPVVVINQVPQLADTQAWQAVPVDLVAAQLLLKEMV